jgi:alpha/beta superfamily hydrolase
LFVDLLQTTTRDGLRLDGMFQEASGATSTAALQAMCLVHGTGGNFYSSSLFEELAQTMLKMGCHVLRVNTRGHDGISNAVTARGGKRQGAAYEVIDDCRHDIAAWVEWLKQRGYARIGLLGHSMGAVKCLYALAQEPQSAVQGVLALSPPRLAYSWFCQSARREEFLQTFHRAEELVEQGAGGALLEVTMPLPMVITAAGYVEKYGPAERYNFLDCIAGVRCPALVTIGSLEAQSHPAFQGTVEALQSLQAQGQRLRVELIPGADHFYSAARPELRQVLQQWLTTALA